MEELHAADDQSHYEISLTAGQAFMAFVLLLLSLAASFAFGLMIGKGQADERLVVQKETPIVTEASMAPKKKADDGRIVELGVSDDEFQETATAEETASAPATETPIATDTTITATVIEEALAPVVTETAAAAPIATPAPAPRGVTTYAQLLSTENKLTAESLAAKLIDRGFTAAYVERGSTEKGPIYRVRVKFDSDSAARAAEAKLKEFSKDVWITTR